MSTALATMSESNAIEQVLVTGDLAKLSTEQRVSYYNAVCESLGLNPLTKPFDYINLNGKLRLYATRDCTEQLRKIHGVSITRLEKEFQDDLYVVTAYASDSTGRTDASTGVVHLGTKKGEDRANALMKGETKAKRRVTLSICGLGLLDETETQDITSGRPEAATVVTAPTVTTAEGETVSAVTGEVVSEDGLLRIERVDSRPTKTNKPRWLVVFSDGVEAWTFRDQQSSLAEQLCQERAEVIYEAEDKGKWGFDLKELGRAPQLSQQPEPEPPPAVITDADIPF